jgi:hypothetical protein
MLPRTCVGLYEAHVGLHHLQAVLSDQLLHQLDALRVGRNLTAAAAAIAAWGR